MKREKNISRKVALNLWLPIIVVVFILVAALGVIEVNPGLGYTILVGDVIYLIASVLCYEYTEKMINNELLTAGFEQSQIQKQILKELPVPYVMTVFRNRGTKDHKEEYHTDLSGPLQKGFSTEWTDERILYHTGRT